MPTLRSIEPRPTAATPSASMARAWIIIWRRSARSVFGAQRLGAGPVRGALSAFCHRPVGDASTDSRRWCAGATPSAACCRLRNSSTSPRGGIHRGSGRVGAAQGLRGCRCLTHLYRPGGEHLAVPMHPALTQTVMNALATSRLTPGQLELEITETASRLGATSVAGARRQNLHGTISAPAIPRSVICEAFRSTRSRSTRAS
jgi:hypothetical protein